MIQVDFYILYTASRQEKDRLACQLAEKAWHQGYRLYIQTTSFVHAQRLDDLLWTFKDISFLPHEIYSEGPLLAPISIGYASEMSENPELLINLTETVPSFLTQFKRIAELVDDTPQAREAGRSRYRFYQQDKNYQLKVHEIHRRGG